MGNRKINKIKVSIVLIIICILLLNLTGFGRYIYNTVKESYLTSKNFYFTSNLLEVNEPSYTYNNWSGSDVYKLDIELYSFENELLRADEDLDYNISCTTTSTKITCAVGSQAGTSTTTGTITTVTNEKVVSIYLIPNEDADFVLGENVDITVTAYTTEPYSKTISADFTFVITAIGADYQIEDKENQNYALVKLKNTEAINTNVTLRFNPEVVRLDMNDEVYLNNISYQTEEIDEHDYVNEITFTLTEESSKNIKFYKVDKSQDYSDQLDIFEVVRVEI